MASLLSSSSTATGVAASSVNKSYTLACTPGSLLYAVVFWQSGTETCTVADPTNGNWTAIGSPVIGSGGLAGFSSQAFYFSGNMGITALSVTATFTGSVAASGIAIHEYAGVNTLEAHSELMDSSGATVSSPSLTPASFWGIALSWVVCSGHVNTLSGGFTLRENTNFGGNGTGDILLPARGSPVSATWATSSTGNMVGTVLFNTPPFPLNPACLPFVYLKKNR